MAPFPEYLESLAPYSPIVLPCFDKEEYVNRSEEDEGVVDATMVLGNEVTNLAEESKRTVAETFGEKSAEETREDADEDAARDPPPEL